MTQTFKLWDIVKVDHPAFHRGPYMGYVVFYDDRDDTYLIYLPSTGEGHDGRRGMTPQEAHNILDLLPQGTNDFFWSSPRFMKSTYVGGRTSILGDSSEVVMTRNTPESWWFGPHSEFVEGDIVREHTSTTEDGENRYQILFSDGDHGFGVSPTMFVPKVLVANTPTPQKEEDDAGLKPGDIVRCVSDEGMGITNGATYFVHGIEGTNFQFYDNDGDERFRPIRHYEKVEDRSEEPGPMLGDHFWDDILDTPSSPFTVAAEETKVNTFSFPEMSTDLHAVVDDDNDLVAITVDAVTASELVNATMLNQETYRVVRIKR